MESVIVEVFLPATQKSYEIKIPLGLNVLTASDMIAKALAEISEGDYLSSKNSCLAWRETGDLLDMKKALKECNVVNGSKLILV